MIQPTAGPLPRRRPRHHCRRLVGQVEDSGHGMGHAVRGPNIAEFRVVEVREPLNQTVQALNKWVFRGLLRTVWRRVVRTVLCTWSDYLSEQNPKGIAREKNKERKRRN